MTAKSVPIRSCYLFFASVHNKQFHWNKLSWRYTVLGHASSRDPVAWISSTTIMPNLDSVSQLVFEPHRERIRFNRSSPSTLAPFPTKYKILRFKDISICAPIELSRNINIAVESPSALIFPAPEKYDHFQPRRNTVASYSSKNSTLQIYITWNQEPFILHFGN